MDFKFESTLSKFLDYSLKPGIDPSDPTLDPKKAQAIIEERNTLGDIPYNTEFQFDSENDEDIYKL